MRYVDVAMWIVGICMVLITGYIFVTVINLLISPPTIIWCNVKQVGAPIPVTPLLALTVLDIMLTGILIQYLSYRIKDKDTL